MTDGTPSENIPTTRSFREAEGENLVAFRLNDSITGLLVISSSEYSSALPFLG
ncbi:MAG: hypothetical protein ACI8PT_002830 [Gammaproteobacteria bacterium]|jgi:hypothetical protein